MHRAPHSTASRWERLLRSISLITLSLGCVLTWIGMQYKPVVRSELQLMKGKVTALGYVTPAGKSKDRGLRINLTNKTADYIYPDSFPDYDKINSVVRVGEEMSFFTDASSGRRWIWELAQSGERLVGFDQTDAAYRQARSRRLWAGASCLLVACACGYGWYTLTQNRQRKREVPKGPPEGLPPLPEEAYGAIDCCHCFRKVLLTPSGACPACGCYYMAPPTDERQGKSLLWLDTNTKIWPICCQCGEKTDDYAQLQVEYKEADHPGTKRDAEMVAVGFLLAIAGYSRKIFQQNKNQISITRIIPCCKKCSSSSPPKVYEVDYHNYRLGVLVEKTTAARIRGEIPK